MDGLICALQNPLYIYIYIYSCVSPDTDTIERKQCFFSLCLVVYVKEKGPGFVGGSRLQGT